MSQDMDHMGAPYIIHFEVTMLDQFEQTKFCILTLTTLDKSLQTIQHCIIYSLCFM